MNSLSGVREREEWVNDHISNSSLNAFRDLIDIPQKFFGRCNVFLLLKISVKARRFLQEFGSISFVIRQSSVADP